MTASAEPRWIPKSVVLAIHDEQLAEHGGGRGLRDDSLLEAALARPRNLFHYGDAPDLAALAAAYAYGLAKDHPFIDGNKRTSFVVCELFLALNGMGLGLDDAQAVTTWLTLASGGMTEAELAARLRSALWAVE
ncbi:type II toxin-antitoxin system death-on-curing family toxin [Aquabacter sp. L1I39]|uniref:type II toxin-antitoxin system death-on-curing family toxin n=1 Tax=Aquabacter sp. L1I39 TaxID=2820278 RepID=UPI001ADA10F5|nr:type II toxin-antitoxin system death-on-curing family toxin [Aquabacter sp. L1I39]QTL05605.1 type II toxin-antitoxin system death-on-curing family toxin [Aquabacter sp. L1I39]